MVDVVRDLFPDPVQVHVTAMPDRPHDDDVCIWVTPDGDGPPSGGTHPHAPGGMRGGRRE